MLGDKRVLAITLARGGSKRIPHKNTAMLNGKPLLEYTIDAAHGSAYIDSYFVSTDCQKVMDVCSERGVRIIERPADLASDTATSADALLHASQFCGHHFDYIVELMTTNPFKTSDDIDSCLSALHHGRGVYNSVVSVARVWDNHPSRLKYLDANGVMQDFFPEVPESRRQDLVPAAYVRNGAIYATTAAALVRTRCRYAPPCKAYIMEDSINIDEPVDLKIAEAMLCQRSPA